MCSSRSCFSSTGDGACVSRSCARWVLGKAMTSRMDSVPAIIATMRSKPNAIDRKSTRLNSSHTVISYAVFCLKKKKIKKNKMQTDRQRSISNTGKEELTLDGG